jgi:hypothetical protein
MSVVLCSNCFVDQGLRFDAEQIGDEDDSACPNCGSTSGRKLSMQKALELAHRFFVWGTLNRVDYGAAPVVVFNEHQKTDIDISQWYEKDVELLGNTLGIGFFYYGPNLWMLG